MILADYTESQKRNILIASELWDYKERNDLTIYALSKQLDSEPEQVEKWLSGYVALPADKLSEVMALIN